MNRAQSQKPRLHALIGDPIVQVCNFPKFGTQVVFYDQDQEPG